MSLNPHEPILPPPTPKGPFKPIDKRRRKPLQVTAHLTAVDLTAALKDYFGFPDSAKFRFKVDTVSSGPREMDQHMELTGVDIEFTASCVDITYVEDN